MPAKTSPLACKKNSGPHRTAGTTLVFLVVSGGLAFLAVVQNWGYGLYAVASATQHPRPPRTYPN